MPQGKQYRETEELFEDQTQADYRHAIFNFSGCPGKYCLKLSDFRVNSSTEQFCLSVPALKVRSMKCEVHGLCVTRGVWRPRWRKDGQVNGHKLSSWWSTQAPETLGQYVLTTHREQNTMGV